MDFNNNLSQLTVSEILKLNAATIEELRTRNVIRTKNNPVGDYTEWLVARALGLELMTNSSAGYDARSESGVRVQIKARRVTPSNKSRQLGAIRNLDKLDFDLLVAVIFNDDFEVIEGVSIPHALVGEYSVYRAHQNAHIIHLRGRILDDPRVENIRDRLTLCAESL